MKKPDHDPQTGQLNPYLESPAPARCTGRCGTMRIGIQDNECDGGCQSPQGGIFCVCCGGRVFPRRVRVSKPAPAPLKVERCACDEAEVYRRALRDIAETRPSADECARIARAALESVEGRP